MTATARNFGLSDGEYAGLLAQLGRQPNQLELAVVAGMWSEHCSYKSTRHLLRDLPSRGPRVLAGPGSHAGVIDVGEGWAVSFKIESHNHPSAVEPYQGAATGVGGILRDIIASGARPCAILDALCFGSPGSVRTRYLRRGITAGIAGYGNAIGVPNLGGCTRYDPRYEQNPLVNVLGAGLLRHADGVRSAHARGLGNAVVLVGATTGRDGILGAAFASEALGDAQAQASQRPRVQVGDPFAGKRLLEACIGFSPELGYVAGQDLGACGLACATFEIAAASGVGMEVDLDAVPLREAGMTPPEIFLSESQERFLFIVDAGRVEQALAHFRSHGLHAAAIGQLVAGDRVAIRSRGETLCDLPAALVAGGAPPSGWPVAEKLPEVAPYPTFSLPRDLGAVLLGLLALPALADHESIYGCFDQTVGNRTVRGPGQAAAAVLRLPQSRRGFALTLTGRGELGAANPYLGAQAAVAQACRDLAAAGAALAAVTDGINCASPRDPVENRRLGEQIRGLGDALRTLEVPVTGGNVSLYNESPAGPIPPTMFIGALGLVDDVGRVPGVALSPGLVLFIVGPLRWDAVSSCYGETQSGLLSHGQPAVDLPAEKALAALLVAEAQAGRLPVCKPASAGGLGVALAKLALRGGCGADVDLAELPPCPRPDWLLFGEYPAQAWAAVRPDDADAFADAARRCGVPVWRVGTSGGERLQARGLFDVPLSSLRPAFFATSKEPHVGA